MLYKIVKMSGDVVFIPEHNIVRISERYKERVPPAVPGWETTFDVETSDASMHARHVYAEYVVPNTTGMRALEIWTNSDAKTETEAAGSIVLPCLALRIVHDIGDEAHNFVVHPLATCAESTNSSLLLLDPEDRTHDGESVMPLNEAVAARRQWTWERIKRDAMTKENEMRTGSPSETV